MSKVTRNGGTFYCCGSYKRWPSICTRHEIAPSGLGTASAGRSEPAALRRRGPASAGRRGPAKGQTKGIDDGHRALQTSLDRLHCLRQAVYEDYREGLLSREDYLRYRADYERQTAGLGAASAHLSGRKGAPPRRAGWNLLSARLLLELDRTMAEAVEQIPCF